MRHEAYNHRAQFYPQPLNPAPEMRPQVSSGEPHTLAVFGPDMRVRGVWLGLFGPRALKGVV